MVRAMKIIFSVTRAFSGAGLLGGLVLGALFPCIVLPLMLVGMLFGYEAEFGTLLLVAVFAAATGALVGLAVGVLVGLASSILTLLFLRDRIGSVTHRRLIRALSVVTAAMLMFLGVGLLTGSTDMSANTVLIWRLPSALIAAGYGWWLAGRMAYNHGIWHPTEQEEAWPAKPWEYGRG